MLSDSLSVFLLELEQHTLGSNMDPEAMTESLALEEHPEDQNIYVASPLKIYTEKACVL